MFEQIKSQLKAQIAEMTETDVAEINDEVPLSELGVDSLMALELLVMLERTYKIEIDQEELKGFTSVNATAELIAQHLEGKTAT